MREVKFLDQVREAAHQNRIWQPKDQLADLRTSRTWPLCLTCGREVDSVDLKNANQNSVEVWASCSHRGERNPPAEDYYRVVFPFRVDGNILEDERSNFYLKRAMQDFCPFPMSHRE